MDWRLWKKASEYPSSQSQQSIKDGQSVPHHNQQMLVTNTSLYCCVDGSWIDPTSKAGIGWALYNTERQCLIKGSSSIEPTSSALETEALALREAILQIKRLNYCDVTFCGDSKILYTYLETAMQQDQPPPGNLEIQNYLEDILLINKGMYHFKYIPREINAMADKLAREARVMKSPFVVSWVT
ncbi:hypothetical protein ARALYDRAFT_899583 [Arabidopsis lyrata subsp. lyrata]|uniref:RNase H type-1 domain-containing protein n=1 Tax=Arabidopsis lyrata subsp. lyrata TaxID=81972 RepID=D7L033_ARALL|nr:hypothetical protein ARALYDRAFT_899583 [Arabidopsis lyrata subsp. lyrata]